MKRFLRYLAYREFYRSLRKLLESSGESQSAAPRNQQSLPEHPDLPAEGETIDSPAQLKAALQEMDPYKFEQFVADLWERMGWETTVSTASMDSGVDVTARKSHPYEQRLLIQAKRYGPNTTVGAPDIQQYASLRHQFESVDKVLLVTTNEFTQPAKETAADLNVKCINGDELVGLITEYKALDLVVEYLPFLQPASAVESDKEETVGIEERNSPSDVDAEPTATSNDSATTAHSSAANTDATALPTTIWHRVVLGATVGWIAVFVGVTALSDLVWGLLFFGSWLALPVAIFLDSRAIRNYTDWPQYRWLYLIGSLIWVLAIIPAAVYLWQRRSVAKELAATTDAAEEG